VQADLDKATQALADGRADEASVHAWNALAGIGPDEADAAELTRIARELEDPQLLREIERRRFFALSVQPAQPEPVTGKQALRLVRAWPAPLVVLLVLIAIVASIRTESGARHPAAKDVASKTHFTRPIAAETSGVWLVPLGEPMTVNVARLADELSVRYHVPVGTLPDLALPSWTLDEREHRLVAEQLIRLLGQAYGAQGSAVIIGITDYDMYVESGDLAHAFSLRAPPHYGAVSTSPLAADLVDRLRGHSRHERARKLVARIIGFVYYARHEVDDPHSLLRSQMHGVDDIDKLDEALYVDDEPLVLRARARK
jgi:hypothetical protein